MNETIINETKAGKFQVILTDGNLKVEVYGVYNTRAEAEAAAGK